MMVLGKELKKLQDSQDGEESQDRELIGKIWFIRAGPWYP
jgi:hypothetical protein